MATKLRNGILLAFSILGVLIIAILFSYSALVSGYQRDVELTIRKDRTLALALELKQSADDLTRCARLFIATGDPIYETYFREMVEIRDGVKAHPAEYGIYYWDFVFSGSLPPDNDGEFYNIGQRISSMALTSTERGLLSAAGTGSDALLYLEDTAFNAVKGVFRDGEGNFSIRGAEDREYARNLLNGSQYHNARAEIMESLYCLSFRPEPGLLKAGSMIAGLS